MAETAPRPTPDQAPPVGAVVGLSPPVSATRRWERVLRRRPIGKESRTGGNALLGFLRRMFHLAQHEKRLSDRRRNVAQLAISMTNTEEPNAGGLRNAKRREMSKSWQRMFRRTTP